LQPRRAAQVRIEPLTGVLCLHSVNLPGEFHRDPGDRLIVALARTLDAELITGDGKILRYPGVRSIAAT
jgi:PIN domain nuclease of toxin-antitoxin system